MTFGDKLSRLRKEYNYTQEQLADILGVSRQSISKWESDTSYPETDKLIELGNLFDCSMDYLLKEEITERSGIPSASTEGVLAQIGRKVTGDENKRKVKRILKIVGMVLAAIFTIDIVSLIVYFLAEGIPH